jgi:hypothetical protein
MSRLNRDIITSFENSRCINAMPAAAILWSFAGSL